MSKTKKPTAAQLKVLQKMNENLCILAWYSGSTLLDVYIHKYKENSHLDKIKNKTLEILKSNEWVLIDHSKRTQSHVYYFITEKGKSAANGENKAS